MGREEVLLSEGPVVSLIGKEVGTSSAGSGARLRQLFELKSKVGRASRMYNSTGQSYVQFDGPVVCADSMLVSSRTSYGGLLCVEGSHAEAIPKSCVDRCVGQLRYCLDANYPRMRSVGGDLGRSISLW